MGRQRQDPPVAGTPRRTGQRGSPPLLDLLVLGSGVAGLSAAVRAAETHGLQVGVLTKGDLDQATTRWAQGGVAAVLGGDPDSTDLHLADTLAAGVGLCDVDAVRTLVGEGPARVHELIALGAIFDRDPNGDLALAREGGHSHARVVHAGGAATGLEVERALVAAVRRTAAAIYERWFACDLLVEGGRCTGVLALPPDAPGATGGGAAGAAAEPRRAGGPGAEGGPRPGQAAAQGQAGGLAAIRARHVLVATGGAGQLFAVTTNPGEATGDGIAMALRAGAAVADLEFVQFHPTALHHPSRPRPLLSEALRGHGALLRDAEGERFVDELLPRDRVSRAVQARMAEQGVDHVWLDATGLEAFAERFPTIAAALGEVGLDPARDWLPVAPAAHFTCGGVVVDLDGASSLPGLWVAGEAACNGVHGANRLASNSLLDGMVFGPRVVEAVERGKDGPEPTGAMRAVFGGHGPVLPPGAPGAPGGSGSDGSPGGGAGIRGTGSIQGIRGIRLDLPPATPRSAGGTVPEAPLPEAAARTALQRAMSAHAGVLRSASSLDAALASADAALAAAHHALDATARAPVAARDAAGLEGVTGNAPAPVPGGALGGATGGGPTATAAWVRAFELANLAVVGRVVCAVARARRETRGCHARSDATELDPALRARIVVTGTGTGGSPGADPGSARHIPGVSR